MDRQKASAFSQELLDLFDEYVHGVIDRPAFLIRAAKLAVGGATAAGLLEALSPRFAEAQQIAKDDERLHTEFIEYESPLGSGKMRGYLARPAGARGVWPAVLVVHENRGLNPHIEDIARRLALEGFLTFAPDALTPLGGYPGDEDTARAEFARLDQSKTREDFVAAVALLKKRADSTGRVAVVGFCYGGAIANMLATRIPDLAAAVPFYGMQPKAEDVAKIRAPLLIHYAENDDRINAGIAAYEQALEANAVRYRIHQYPGTQHGFSNDTTPRYDPAAAALAWKRTVDFLKKNLPAPFDLARFHEAQNRPYNGFADALRELRAGRKRGHWIWYVFPQLRGLGSSEMAVRYGLDGPDEGVAYLADGVLAARLAEAAGAVRSHLQPKGGSPLALDVVMGSRIDVQKLVSSMTLFAGLARRLDKLDEERRPDVRALAEHAEAILASAEAQGYPRCAATEGAIPH